MGKNQLFCKHLSDEVVNRIVEAFGFRSLNDRRSFSRSDLNKLNTVDKVGIEAPIRTILFTL